MSSSDKDKAKEEKPMDGNGSNTDTEKDEMRPLKSTRQGESRIAFVEEVREEAKALKLFGSER